MDTMENKLNSNPLSSPFSGPFECTPFDKIKVEHFLPAIEAGLVQAKKNIESIKWLSGEPQFENTIEALESASELLDRSSEAYFNLFSAHATPELQVLAAQISPKLAEFSSDVSQDEKLFERVKSVYENREKLGLKGEALRLTEKTYKSFVRNGAKLGADAKDKLRKIDQEAAGLWPKFSENVLSATQKFFIEIKEKSELTGLPESAVEAARMEAEKRSLKDSWVFTLDYPSYVAVMTYAENEKLREQMARAQGTRCVGGEFDNSQIAQRIAILRHDRANVLGYKTHADYVLEERMAESAPRVQSFMKRILDVSRPAALKEIAEVKLFKKELTGNDNLKPWDVAYFSEKLKVKKFQFEEEELRPYFKLENVIDGVFTLAGKLYNLEFKTLSNVPVYHEEVRVSEVLDKKTGKHVGLLYQDFFPRATKRSGAWMTSFREQGKWAGKIQRPHVAIVCNFTKPTNTKPSLLTLNEVLTLFHEFGHALHGLLSDCEHRSIAGTNVFWDFVELPSQIMENWVFEKEALDLFAKHYETGASIPADLVKKVENSSTFQAGLQNVRQLMFAMLDFAWHSKDPSPITSIKEFEEKILTPIRVVEAIEGSAVSCSFSHVFSGGYSAGYYSYKWAEVLDADAFEFFKEKGIFSLEVAQKFREHVLSKGGSEHPMELYKKFRGREPDPDALLRREELL
jgi:peptidyl-dipeptidase Dcp